MSPATPSEASSFTLKTPYLQQGVTTETRANTDILSIAVKVYAEGGENRLHQHPTEDHSFIVLEGEATFHVGEVDRIEVLRRFDGMMLPMGTPYYFQSSGPDNLVMIRIGATAPGEPPSAFYVDGQEKSLELEPEKNRLPRLERSGPGFGDR